MIESTIESVVTPIIPVCVPWQYSGEAMEYCVYSYSEIPDEFGDDAAGSIRYVIQLHWFFPWEPKGTSEPDIQRKKKEIRDSLFRAGFTFPTVENVGDGEWMDVVFECEIAGEV